MKNENRLTNYTLSQGPHIYSKQNVNIVMWIVIISLLPAAVNSIFIFGLKSLYVILTCIGSALAAEIITRFFLKREITIKNGSAVLTGLLLAFNVSPDFPLWMAAIGSFFAIVIVKELFGGLGHNIFNPALAARAFLMASWPTEMTGLWHKFTDSNILMKGIEKTIVISKSSMDTLTSATYVNLPQDALDVITSATPLAALKEVPIKLAAMNISSDRLYDILFSKSMFWSLFKGNIGGCLGETSVLWLLAGALLLLLTRIITWHIPLSYLLSFSFVILLYYNITGFKYPNEALLFHLLSGGLILGAFYMATDMVTTPINYKGMLIFGVGCGLLTAVIRLWGGYPEGVSYSILLMNTTVPLIDRWTKRKIYGAIS